MFGSLADDGDVNEGIQGLYLLLSQTSIKELKKGIKQI